MINISIKIPQELIDAIAKEEVRALLEGLHDPELRKNPQFMAKVRAFLKENGFVTTTETEGVKEIKHTVSEIPDLVSEDMMQ
ncbi:MAG: hypothetical protein IJ510_00860 [Selenomonadales bacterium]|nr:hypothetical protein [Selenomonadales bacterium]